MGHPLFISDTIIMACKFGVFGCGKPHMHLTGQMYCADCWNDESDLTGRCLFCKSWVVTSTNEERQVLGHLCNVCKKKLSRPKCQGCNWNRTTAPDKQYCSTCTARNLSQIAVKCEKELELERIQRNITELFESKHTKHKLCTIVVALNDIDRSFSTERKKKMVNNLEKNMHRQELCEMIVSLRERVC
jgi:hypothetical protein